MFPVQLRQCSDRKTMTEVHATCQEMAPTAHLTCALDRGVICVIVMLRLDSNWKNSLKARDQPGEEDPPRSRAVLLDLAISAKVASQTWVKSISNLRRREIHIHRWAKTWLNLDKIDLVFQKRGANIHIMIMRSRREVHLDSRAHVKLVSSSSSSPPKLRTSANLIWSQLRTTLDLNSTELSRLRKRI